MKRNRFVLLMLVMGGLLATTGTSGTHQVSTSPTAAHTCQHTTAATIPDTDETAIVSTQTTEPSQRISERLITALDAFARLVMVM